MSDGINSIRGDKSHLFGGSVAGAYMANNDVKDINIHNAKERNVDLSGVSAWCHPKATA